MKSDTAHCRSDHYLFYAEDLTSDRITLSPAEAVHAATVLRLPEGAPVRLTNGKGTVAEGIITTASGKNVHVSITQRTAHDRPQPALHLFIGLPERDAFEQILTAVTPFEVTSITPLITSFTQKPWWKNNWEKQHQRFNGKMVTALKQSHAGHLPQLHPPVKFPALSPATEFFGYVADQHGERLQGITLPAQTKVINCFVGPPGGFSPEELRFLVANNCTKVKIAHNRLRTELAATTLIAQISGLLL